MKMIGGHRGSHQSPGQLSLAHRKCSCKLVSNDWPPAVLLLHTDGRSTLRAPICSIRKTDKSSYSEAQKVACKLKPGSAVRDYNCLDETESPQDTCPGSLTKTLSPSASQVPVTQILPPRPSQPVPNFSPTTSSFMTVT